MGLETAFLTCSPRATVAFNSLLILFKFSNTLGGIFWLFFHYFTHYLYSPKEVNFCESVDLSVLIITVFPAPAMPDTRRFPVVREIPSFSIDQYLIILVIQ